MQRKTPECAEFSERTERLAVRLGVSLRDLAGIIGVSQAMLFAYRSGQQTISGKAWRKLEHAEQGADRVSSDSAPRGKVAEDAPAYGVSAGMAEHLRVIGELRAQAEAVARDEVQREAVFARLLAAWMAGRVASVAAADGPASPPDQLPAAKQTAG